MSAQVLVFLEPKLQRIQEWIESNDKLDKVLIPIEEKTGVKKSYQVIIASVLVVLWLASGQAGQLLCNLIGILYPSYASIKAIGIFKELFS